MLMSLHVHNFALIEDAVIEFTEGFNVFSGETGAGKSILIDAFGIALGNRASVDYIRKGAEEYWVQAVFDIAELSEIKDMLEEQGLESEEDNLFIRRRVFLNGKSQTTVNGVQVPLAFLHRLTEFLVDIHGQHENQQLLKVGAPQVLIDLYGAAEIKEIFANYQQKYKFYLQTKEELDLLLEKNSDREKLLDVLTWEVQEIDDAKLSVGEDDELQEEAKLLTHGSKIIEATSRSYQLLNGDETELRGVLDYINDARTNLASVEAYDSKLHDLYLILDSVWFNLEDVRQTLGDYLAETTFEPKLLDEIQERLDLIYRLKKKYGVTISEILEYAAKAKIQREELLLLDEHIAQKRKILEKAKQELLVCAQALTVIRKKMASEFTAKITEHIRDLAMEDANFTAEFKLRNNLAANGVDDITFYFNANLGQEAKPLLKVASGGELSRIALAIKTVLLEKSGVPTMVFDEIDTGVGGVTAQRMAEKIAIIAKVKQVLCITHLAQIACFADNHLYITKSTKDGQTITQIRSLSETEKIEEIMRMTGGTSMTSAARDNAKQLLALASQTKKISSAGN